MAQELAYVIITPYSLYKSRTGGILSRLITRTGLDLAAVRGKLSGDVAHLVLGREDLDVDDWLEDDRPRLRQRVEDCFAAG